MMHCKRTTGNEVIVAMIRWISVVVVVIIVAAVDQLILLLHRHLVCMTRC